MVVVRRGAGAVGAERHESADVLGAGGEEVHAVGGADRVDEVLQHAHRVARRPDVPAPVVEVLEVPVRGPGRVGVRHDVDVVAGVELARVLPDVRLGVVGDAGVDVEALRDRPVGRVEHGPGPVLQRLEQRSAEARGGLVHDHRRERRAGDQGVDRRRDVLLRDDERAGAIGLRHRRGRRRRSGAVRDHRRGEVGRLCRHGRQAAGSEAARLAVGDDPGDRGALGRQELVDETVGLEADRLVGRERAHVDDVRPGAEGGVAGQRGLGIGGWLLHRQGDRGDQREEQEPRHDGARIEDAADPQSATAVLPASCTRHVVHGLPLVETRVEAAPRRVGHHALRPDVPENG